MLKLFQNWGNKIGSLFGESSKGWTSPKADTSFAWDTFSSALPWMAYDQEHGLFLNKSSMGFVIETIPLVGCSDTAQNEIASIFQDILEEHESIQFLLWADPRTDGFLNKWSKAKPGVSDICKEMAQRRTDFFQKSVSCRIFRFILSYTKPTKGDVEPLFIENFKKKKEKILQILSSMTYAFSWNIDDFLANMEAFINFSTDSRETKHVWNPYQSLSSQITSGGLVQVHDTFLRLKTETETHFKCYRVANFPDEWALNAMQRLIGDMFRDAYRIKEPFFIHYGVHCPKQTGEESRFWKRSHLIEKQGRSSTLLRFIPDLESELKECDFVRKALNQQERFVYTQICAGLWAPPERFYQAEQSLKTIFRINQFSLTENKFVQRPSFLGCLPMSWGEYVTDLKKMNVLRTTLTSECANFVPILGEWNGTSTPGMLLIGRRGQLANWNPFDNKTGNYNIIVVGRSGSGKSVFMQDLLLSGLRMGAKVFILEVGRSFEKFCELLEGQYIKFSNDANICLNPFANIPLDDDEERDTAFSYVKSIIGTMAAPTEEPITRAENGFIERAIKHAWESKQTEATITDVALWLQSQGDPRATTLGVTLTSYTKGGVYSKYFEGKNNVDFTNPLVLIELEELKEKKDLQAVVFQLFVMAITSQAFLGDRKTPFFICIDEGWDLLRGKQSGVFIETLARRLRKYNGSLVIGSQGIDEFYSTPGSLAAYENSDWLCMLAQKQSSVDRLVSSKKLNISDSQKYALESLMSRHGEYSEVMICDADGNYSVQRLVLDRFSQLLYSTKPEEYTKIKELRKQGMPISQAIEKIIGEQNSHAA